MKEPTLGNPQNTIEVLQKYNFSFQKKFGQNFLIDTRVLDKIIAAAGVTKEDMEQLPPYGRILAFNERGREILAKAKNHATIPYAASIAKLSQLSDIAERFAELEIKASDIYGLALETVTSAQKDYRAKIMIDMESFFNDP